MTDQTSHAWEMEAALPSLCSLLGAGAAVRQLLGEVDIGGPDFCREQLQPLVLCQPFVGNATDKAPSSHFPPTKVLGQSSSPSHPSPQVWRRLDLGCLGYTLHRPCGITEIFSRSLWGEVGIGPAVVSLGAKVGVPRDGIGSPHPKPAPEAGSLRISICCGELDSVCIVGRVRVVCFRGGGG